jgi:hypothetical protein
VFRLWIHFAVLYFISFSAYALLYIVRVSHLNLYFIFSLSIGLFEFHGLEANFFGHDLYFGVFHVQEFKHIANLRLDYLANVLPQPDQFTVLVQAIPAPENEELSYSDNVDYFFRRFHPIEYLSHHMVYKSSYVTSLLVRSTQGRI